MVGFRCAGQQSLVSDDPTALISQARRSLVENGRPRFATDLSANVFLPCFNHNSLHLLSCSISLLDNLKHAPRSFSVVGQFAVRVPPGHHPPAPLRSKGYGEVSRRSLGGDGQSCITIGEPPVARRSRCHEKRGGNGELQRAKHAGTSIWSAGAPIKQMSPGAQEPDLVALS